MTPAELLAYADRLLQGIGIAGDTSRLAALLARQALEMIVNERCVALGADCSRASMRSRLAVVRALDDRNVADALTSLWHQLSACCHQHAYELSPTTAEVRELCDRVSLAVPSRDEKGSRTSDPTLCSQR